MYWWVLAKHRGKFVLLGPFSTDAEADNVATEYAEAKTYQLNTRDDAKAARLLKYKLSSGDRDLLLTKFKRSPTGESPFKRSSDAVSSSPIDAESNRSEPPF